MSVLIKGMKMPEKCGLCDLFHAESPMHCTVVKGHKTVGAPYGMPRPEWCPLVELPEKHGDLIDRDEVRDSVFHHLSIKGEENLLPAEKSVFGNIIKAKAVVEAEESE